MSQPAPYGPPQNAPVGYLTLHWDGPTAPSMVATPLCTIDGVAVPVTWGDNPLVLPAGYHVIEGSLRKVYEYGKARLDVQVNPDQAIHVYYMAPAAAFGGGSIGLAPVASRGAKQLWMVFAVVILLTVALVVLKAGGVA